MASRGPDEAENDTASDSDEAGVPQDHREVTEPPPETKLEPDALPLKIIVPSESVVNEDMVEPDDAVHVSPLEAVEEEEPGGGAAGAVAADETADPGWEPAETRTARAMTELVMEAPERFAEAEAPRRRASVAVRTNPSPKSAAAPGRSSISPSASAVGASASATSAEDILDDDREDRIAAAELSSEVMVAPPQDLVSTADVEEAVSRLERKVSAMEAAHRSLIRSRQRMQSETALLERHTERFSVKAMMDLEAQSRKAAAAEDSSSGGKRPAGPPPSSFLALAGPDAAAAAGPHPSTAAGAEGVERCWVLQPPTLFGSWKRRLLLVYSDHMELFADEGTSSSESFALGPSASVSPMQERKGLKKPCMELVDSSPKPRTTRFAPETESLAPLLLLTLENRIERARYEAACQQAGVGSAPGAVTLLCAPLVGPAQPVVLSDQPVSAPTLDLLARVLENPTFASAPVDRVDLLNADVLPSQVVLLCEAAGRGLVAGGSTRPLSLRCLDLSSNLLGCGVAPRALAAFLSHAPASLRELRLSGCRLGNEGVDELVRGLGFVLLDVLDLSSNSITSAGVAALVSALTTGRSAPAAALQAGTLAADRLLPPRPSHQPPPAGKGRCAAGATTSSDPCRSTSSDGDVGGPDDESARAWPALGPAVAPPEGTALVVGHLALDHNLVGDRGAESLCALLDGAAQVRALSLSGNRIGDPGAAFLGASLGRRSCLLERLDLSLNRLSPTGGRALAHAIQVGCPRLERALFLGRTVTPAVVEALRVAASSGVRI